MPSSDNPLLQQQLESHEERLQQVERGLGHVAVSVGKIETSSEHIADAVEQGFDDMKKNHEALFQRLDVHGDTLAAQDLRLKPLEAHIAQQALEKRSRASRYKAAALGLLVTGLGVVVTKLGEALWAWLQQQ